MNKKISENAHLRSDFRKKKHFLEWGSNPRKYYIFRAEIENFFVRFLVQVKIAKSPFEINWPLATSGRFFLSWSEAMCFFRSTLKLKRAEQISHLNFVVVCLDTSCFILICLDRFPFDAKAKGHMEQLKGLIPSSDSIISSKFSEQKEKIHYFHNFQGKKKSTNPRFYKFSYVQNKL